MTTNTTTTNTTTQKELKEIQIAKIMDYLSQDKENAYSLNTTSANFRSHIQIIGKDECGKYIFKKETFNLTGASEKLTKTQENVNENKIKAWLRRYEAKDLEFKELGERGVITSPHYIFRSIEYDKTNSL